MIQDAVFTIGTVVFTIALLPTLRDRQKPPLATSIPITLTLVAFASSFLSLGLWFTAVATAIECGCWGAIAVQRYRQARPWRAEHYR